LNFPDEQLMPPEPNPESQSATDQPSPASLSWRIFRAQETPVRTLIVTLFVIVVIVIALLYYGPIMGFVALLVLFLALNSYYLPTTYTLNEKGMTTDKLLFHYTRGWKEFRSYVRTSGGVVVSPFRNWTYLDNFRGIHLLLPHDPKPVLDYLAQRLPEKKKAGKDPNPRPNQ
jgi:hypothetical protein